MPSSSKSQQRLFGMVHACQKHGKCASPEVSKIADSIKEKDATDFAKTKHDGLPEKKKKKKKKTSSKKRKTFKEFLQDKGYPINEVHYEFSNGQEVRNTRDWRRTGIIVGMVPGNGSIPFYYVRWDDSPDKEEGYTAEELEAR